MVQQIKPNETSFAVALLHLVMQLLQLPVNSKERSAKKAGPATQKAIQAWQKQQQIPGNNNLLVDTATASAITKALQKLGYLDSKLRNTVSGKVSNDKLAPIQQISLLVFDLDLIGIGVYKDFKFAKQLLEAQEGFEYLGTAGSDDTGYYEVAYYDWMFAKSERKRADVVVFAIEGDHIIGRSALVQNAAKTAQDINITIQEAQRNKGEYKPLYNALLSSYLKENGLALKEIGASQDYLSFISGELDIPIDKLQHIVIAHYLNDSSKETLEPELLYGLARQKVSLDWEMLFATSEEVLGQALANAIKEYDIDTFPQKAISQFIDLLKSAAAANMLQPKANDSNIIADLLNLNLKKQADQVQFIKLRSQYKGTDENDFWGNYLPQYSTFNAQTIKTLRLSQDMFVLSGAHIPMVEAVTKAKIKTMPELVKWDANQWKKVIKKTGVPTQIDGANEKEKTDNYVNLLQNGINTKFPTAAVLHKISTNVISFSNAKVKSTINKFLATEEAFDIKLSPMREFENKIKSLAGSDIGYQIQVIGEVKQLQRLVRINPDTSLISVLKENRLTSATSIAEIPLKTFIPQYEKKLGGEKKAMAIYKNATNISTKVSLSETAITEYGSDLMPAYIINKEDQLRLRDSVNARFPGYSKMFNVQLCECRHCNSVYSPAAYFVDLMRYLEHGLDGLPMMEFQKRRPDLFHLPLSCENSNTLIPYIDLANEVMENYLFYGKDNFDEYKSADTGETTEQELRAQPQQIKKEVYKDLSTAVFPFSLPYHLPLETLRLYSNQLGTSWYEVLKTIHPDGPSVDIYILNRTYLNISKKEYEILTDRDGNEASYFGTPNLTGLSKVPFFLEQSGLEYTELITLLKTNFINPNLYKLLELNTRIGNSKYSGKEVYTALKLWTNKPTTWQTKPNIKKILSGLGIKQNEQEAWKTAFSNIKEVFTLWEESSNCDISKTVIRTIEEVNEDLPTTWKEGALQKLHTFIRLWRKLGWQLEELDCLLQSLDIASFTDAKLQKLAAAKQFIDQTKFSPKQAAVLWGSMDYLRDNNLYGELFLSKAIELNPAFIPTFKMVSYLSTRFMKHVVFEHLSRAERELHKFTPDLISAFKITEEELGIIYDKHEINIQTDSISIGTVSLIYRHVLFANACKLSISELIHYIKLFELTPFDNPSNTVEAYEKIEKIKKSTFSLDDLAHIFGTNIDALTDEEISEQEVLLSDAYDDINLQEIVLSEEQIANGTTIDEVKLDLKKAYTATLLIDFLTIPENLFDLLASKRVDELIALYNPETFKKFVLGLIKANLIVERFSLTENEIPYFAENLIPTDQIDLLDFKIKDWWRLYDYILLKENLPETERTLIDIFKSEGLDEIAQTIKKVTQWNAKDVDYLLSEVHSNPVLFKNEKALLHMQKSVQLSKRMGIATSSLYAFRYDATQDYDKLSDKAEYLKRLLKAKYESKTWKTVATKLNDKLREKQRDSLVSYLLAKDTIRQEGIKDANGLYEFFLIDVQMSGCMDTSRIVQASAAIQQFVNRVHLNLERGISPGALDRNRWKWMKNYRVWEAQLKVWYQNQSYLNPEWRMDKSPFFEELESHLTQNDITERTAEEALRGYLKNMEEVANLNVAGMYEEAVSTGNQKVLHVFGHTNNTPYTYYYRTYNQFGKWGAWEKIDAAIQAISYSEADTNDGGKKTGVHLIPVVWKNRLLLFWPEFMEKSEPRSNSGKTFQDLSNDQVAAQEPKKYWEVRLAWSEYYDKKWTAKKVSEYHIKPIDFWEKQNKAPHEISFSSIIHGSNQLLIFMNEILGSDPFYYAASPNFDISDFSRSIDVNDVFRRGGLTDELYSDSFNNRFLRNTYKYNFNKTNIVNKPLYLSQLYLRNNKNHQLIFPNQLKYNDDPRSIPFFYSSNNKTYFVKQKYLKEAQDLIRKAKEEYGPLGLLFGGLAAGAIAQVLEFNTFHHPYVSNFISNLNKNGIGSGDNRKPGLLESDISIGSSDGIYDDEGEHFTETYLPDFGLVFEPERTKLKDTLNTFYKETIDFDRLGANSKYNWELFFHTPLYIATQLSKNGKHQEAMKWFHYIFDPTTDEIPPLLTTNELARFWKVKPFKTTKIDEFEDFINGLTANAGENRENEKVAEWRDHPFDPHLVASNFPINYMKHVVLAYVENLVHWGDNLFRRFTRENVYEAIQLYVIASHILGPKPQFVPSRGNIKKETYASLREGLNDLSNARVEMENSLLYSSDANDLDGEPSPSLSGTGLAFYFCLPPNENLLKYWELVEDRLFKIRNCKDINGVARRLALFAPPIDPALLIKARSAGLDLEDILQGLYAPNPHYRFTYLLQKANEFCNDVKALGAAVLSAIEKQEGEELSRLRTTHEVEMLGMVQKIKERQILDARTAKELLEKQRETTVFRFKYYNETLLGNEAVEIPSVIGLDIDLDENSSITVNPDISEVIPDVSVALVDGDEEGIKLIGKEREEIRKRKASEALSVIANGGELTASIAALFPQTQIKAQPMGVGTGVAWGGHNIAFGAQMAAKALHTTSSVLSQEAGLTSTTASYIRREQDWTLQANLAAKEIQQLERQILSAGIRVQIAEKELENHKRQIEIAITVENYLKDKFTNKELYQWMKEQLVSVHKQSYDLAFQMAKQAEMAFEFEKGIEASENSFIEPGSFDSSKKGLLAGEKLQLSLRQLELAYQDKNKREYEITKHVSLGLLNPMALIALRASGICDFEIPEVLYDMDHPGHYFRRIKSVSISIPCVTGPYTSVSAKFIHKGSRYRKNTTTAAAGSGYAESETDDRFSYYNNVEHIATSHAQNDSGVFELNFRDERYVPFEGLGAISEWRLELPKEIKQFDYNTISDVIVHIKYTSREEGGDDLKDAANEALKVQLAAIKQGLEDAAGLNIALNMKHYFPNEWHLLKRSGTIDLTIDKSRLPYMAQSIDATIESVVFLAKIKDNPATFTVNVDGAATNLARVDELKLCKGINSDIELETPFTVAVSNTDKLKLEELMMVVKYKF